MKLLLISTDEHIDGSSALSQNGVLKLGMMLARMLLSRMFLTF